MLKTTVNKSLLDIFDWFNSPTLVLVNHPLLAKIDGEERVSRAMSALRKEARKLLNRYKNTDFAYPNYQIN